MSFQRVTQGIGTAVVVLSIASFMCGVSSELISIRSELFDIRRMFAASASRSAAAPHSTRAPSSAAEEADLHA